MSKKVMIEPDEWKIIKKNVPKRWSQHKTGSSWAEGLNKDGTFYGLCGECAVGKIIGEKPNLEYEEKGVPEDFIYKGYNIEVKTSYGNYGSGLLKRKEKSGFVHDLKSNIYVFCTIDKGNYVMENKPIPVTIQGIISKKRILEEFSELHPSKSKKSDHFNLEIPYDQLHPVEELLSLKEKKKEAALF